MKEKMETAVTQWLNQHQGERTVTEISPGLEALLWQTLVQMQNQPFSTLKGLEFTYRIKGHEIFVDRKDKSITKATVILSFWKALELQVQGKEVKGPKMLGTFGASYLYPIFLEMGVIKRNMRQLELKELFPCINSRNFEAETGEKLQMNFEKTVDG